MEYLIYPFILMLTVFVTYVGLIWAIYGILPSISDSFYHLPKKLKFLFTLFCWGFAIPAAMIGFTLAEGSTWQFLMLFAAGGIMFVGAAPDFQNENGMDRIVHYISALIGVISSQLYILLVFPEIYYITVSFALFSILMLIFKKKVEEIWWIEILAFLSICYAFALEIF